MDTFFTALNKFYLNNGFNVPEMIKDNISYFIMAQTDDIIEIYIEGYIMRFKTSDNIADIVEFIIKSIPTEIFYSHTKYSNKLENQVYFILCNNFNSVYNVLAFIDKLIRLHYQYINSIGTDSLICNLETINYYDPNDSEPLNKRKQSLDVKFFSPSKYDADSEFTDDMIDEPYIYIEFEE